MNPHRLQKFKTTCNGMADDAPAPREHPDFVVLDMSSDDDNQDDVSHDEKQRTIRVSWATVKFSGWLRELTDMMLSAVVVEGDGGVPSEFTVQVTGLPVDHLQQEGGTTTFYTFERVKKLFEFLDYLVTKSWELHKTPVMFGMESSEEDIRKELNRQVTPRIISMSQKLGQAFGDWTLWDRLRLMNMLVYFEIEFLQKSWAYYLSQQLQVYKLSDLQQQFERELTAAGVDLPTYLEQNIVPQHAQLNANRQDAWNALYYLKSDIDREHVAFY